MITRDQIADALIEAFKARVAQTSEMTFEETKVTLPHRGIWLYYADAVLAIKTTEN